MLIIIFFSYDCKRQKLTTTFDYPNRSKKGGSQLDVDFDIVVDALFLKRQHFDIIILPYWIKSKKQILFMC